MLTNCILRLNFDVASSLFINVNNKEKNIHVKEPAYTQLLPKAVYFG